MGSLVGLAALLGVAAGADTEGAPAPDPNEIIVTGERRSQTLRQTAASVEVLDKKKLERAPGTQRVDDLFDGIANVQTGANNQAPTIRGQDSTGTIADLAAFLGGARARTTLSVDGRSVGYNEFLFGSAPLWDVEQVEIFRSPQSTVEGRNSIAGTIYVRTRSPSFRPQYSARALIDSVGGRQLSVAVGAPIVADRLAVRLAADWRKGEPSSHLGEVIRGASPNRDDYRWARLKLLATPAILDDTRIELSLQHLWSFSPQTVTVRQPFRKREDPRIGFGVFQNRVSSATLRGETDLSDDLSSLTIASLGKASFRRYAQPGRGEAMTRSNDGSLEQRLTWTPNPRLRLMLGAHGLWQSLDQDIDLSSVIGDGSFKDKQRSTGLFGEAEWKPTPRLTVTTSLRRQSDRQDREGLLVGSGRSLRIDYHKRVLEWLPRASVGYDLSPGLRVGALVQRASVPGGISLNFETNLPEELEAETLWNKEVFLRAQTADRRIRFEFNLFRNDHRNAQRATARLFAQPGQLSLTWFQFYNLPKARTEGMEATLTARPTDTIEVRGTLGLLRAKVIETLPDAPQFDRKTFSRSPRQTGSVSVTWNPDERLDLTARVRGHSAYFSDDANSPLREIRHGFEVDARAAWRWKPLTLALYGRNLFDTFALTTLNNPPTQGTANRPREIGFSVQAEF